jgi:hypothetical protein
LGCEWVIGKPSFVKGLVFNQIEQISEGETGVPVGRGEERQVVPVPAVITKFEGVLSTDNPEDIPPAVIVLNKVPIRKAYTESGTHTHNTYRRYLK